MFRFAKATTQVARNVPRFNVSSSAVTTTSTKRLFNSQILASRENIPVYGAIVGVTALCFQIAVLYPWHYELSDQFLQIEVRFKIFD